MALTYKDYALDGAAVDTISEALQEFLGKTGAERHSIHRVRLTVEEILLNLMGHREGLNVSVGMGRHYGRQIFRLRYASEPFDPTQNGEEPWANDILRSLGLSPSWSYRHGINTVSLVLAERPRRSTVFYILTAVFAAVALGLLGRALPQELREAVDGALLTPLSQGFLGLMKTFSGVMIAFTICSGILGLGDSESLKRMGTTAVLRFIVLSFACSTASALLILPFVHARFASAAQGEASPVGQIARMFFDILPPNIIEPFRTGNSLQIIVIALFAGFGILAIGERGSHLHGLVDNGAALTQNTVSAVSALVPAFIFVLLLRQFWLGDVTILLSFLRPLILFIAIDFFVAAVLWLVSSLRLKCPPMTLLRKTMPPFLVALTTASSVSALPLSMETCEKRLGVRGSTVSFLFPLGSVIYMPAACLYFCAASCALAGLYHVEISPSWLCMAVITSTLLAIAMPPIPGAGILVFTALFPSLGIPLEALVLTTAADLVMDFIGTGLNILLLIFQVACEAASFGSVDRKTLLAK